MNPIRPAHAEAAPTNQLYDRLNEVTARNGETELTPGPRICSF